MGGLSTREHGSTTRYIGGEAVCTLVSRDSIEGKGLMWGIVWLAETFAAVILGLYHLSIQGQQQKQQHSYSLLWHN